MAIDFIGETRKIIESLKAEQQFSSAKSVQDAMDAAGTGLELITEVALKLDQIPESSVSSQLLSQIRKFSAEVDRFMHA